MDVDDGVQRASFAVVLGLPGADWASALEAGEDAFGSQLAETVGGEAARRRGGEAAREWIAPVPEPRMVFPGHCDGYDLQSKVRFLFLLTNVTGIEVFS